MFGFYVARRDSVIAAYEIAERGGYYVIRRHYRNGRTVSDRVSSPRGQSTMRTAVNGRFFPAS